MIITTKQPNNATSNNDNNNNNNNTNNNNDNTNDNKYNLSTTSPIQRLPIDLLLLIWGYLGNRKKDVLNCGAVCKQWRIHTEQVPIELSLRERVNRVGLWNCTFR